jgi:hypothetical protein
MPETIRQRLDRQRKSLLLVFVVSIALAMIPQFWLFNGVANAHSPFLIASGVLGSLGFIGAFVATVFFVKCPKCNARLGQFTVGPFAFRPSRRVNFCPYCGVNFDEPCP